MLKCLNCQLDLTGKYQKKFCNNSCSTIYNNHFKVKSGKYVRLEKKCKHCETITGNSKYCSFDCRKLDFSIPRKYKTQEEKDHATKMRRREASARYAAKKKHQTPVGADLVAIKLFYANCPIGYEVDHIIPISKGGAHSIENFQYLTISENRKKSNKLVPPVRIELTSRV